MYAKLLATGSYLPQQIVTNYDLEKTIDTSHEWIVARTGIHKRHIAAKDETTSSMGTIAAKRALEAANISAQEIDLIIVASCTVENAFPSTAVLIQNQLGIKNIPAFDLNAACSGFNYALSVASSMIANQQVKTVLVVGTEILSKILNWQDRKTCILFGDGAGAVILQAAEQPGLISSKLYADGNYKDLLYAPLFLQDKQAVIPGYIHMQGKEVFKIAVTKLGELVDDMLSANGLQKAAIDWLIPHQANFRIIKAIAKKLNLPMKKVVVTIADHANTSAASIPLALDAAIRDGRIQRGERLLLESFGGGLTWGSSLLIY